MPASRKDMIKHETARENIMKTLFVPATYSVRISQIQT